MNKREIKKLELSIYEETLDNGLKIYVVPKANVNNVYMTFSTKYGSIQSEFVPIDKKEMIKVPDGVAHFLEHKLFEQEKGLAPFDFFSKSGTDCNANTSYNKTTYLFVGNENLKANINYLLDFVNSPYFTEENVEKEKGIIEQELKMYQDNPNSYGFEKILYNSFVKHPIRIPVGGTVSSIYQITIDDLYTCYKTFYHPSNMFVVVTGNVDPEEVIDIIKKNQEKKKYPKFKKIKIKEYDEPDKVYKKNETINMNVTIPKVIIGYKMNINNFDLDKKTINVFSNAYLNLTFGPMSLFSLELTKEKIISRDLAYSFVKTDNHILFVLEAYTTKKEELLKRIEKHIKSNVITEKEFNREKKTMISSTIYMSDNIYRINGYIMNNIINYNKIDYHPYEYYKKLTYDDFSKFINKLDFTNKSTIYIKK